MLNSSSHPCICAALVQGQSASGGSKGLFSGIQLMSSTSSSTGTFPFSLTSTQKPTSSAFTSLSSQNTSPLQSLAGGAIPTLSFGGGSAEKHEQGPSSSTQMGSGSSGYLYLSNLKSLNTRFLARVEKHVRENPYVDLTPVFKDYEKHIGELDKHNGSTPVEAASQSDSESQVGCSVCSAVHPMSVRGKWMGVCVCVCVCVSVCGVCVCECECQ